MRRFVITRLITALFTVLGVATIVFITLHLIPGNFEDAYFISRPRTEENVAALKKRLGLDRPLPVQYFAWLGNAIRGDLGESLRNRRDIGPDLIDRARVTIELTLLATLFSVVVGVPAGVLAARWRGSTRGVGMQVASVVGLSIPDFVMATLLIYLVSTRGLGLPVSGYIFPSDDFLGHLKSMILPSFTLGFITTAIVMRITRSSVLEAQAEPFVTTAYAKGLNQRVVARRHILRNALIPVVTVIGINLGYLLGGAIIVEEIFSLPGVGRYALAALRSRDYTAAQGAVVLAAALFVTVNFIVDIVYAYLDPRIQYQPGGSR